MGVVTLVLTVEFKTVGELNVMRTTFRSIWHSLQLYWCSGGRHGTDDGVQ